MKCECGGNIEFNYISDFIEAGNDDEVTIVMSCSKCLKDYVTCCSYDDIEEYEGITKGNL